MLKRRGKKFCRVYLKFSSRQKIRPPPIKKARKLTSQFIAVKAGVDLLQNTTASAIIDQLMGGNYTYQLHAFVSRNFCLLHNISLFYNIYQSVSMLDHK